MKARMTVETLFAALEPPEESRCVGTYRCRDTIANMRIRVKVQPDTTLFYTKLHYIVQRTCMYCISIN